MQWCDRSLVCALALAACGKGDAGSESTDDSSGGSTAAVDDATTASAGSASASSTSASTGSTTGFTTTASTSVDESSSGSTGSNSDNGITEASGGAGVEYDAVAIPGGLNRLRISKKDSDGGFCSYVTLVDPSDAGMFDAVDVTDPWGVEFANISDVIAACDSDNPGMFGGEGALEATGTITLADPGVSGIPCTVDIDVTMTFEGFIPDIPTMDTMSASGIAVEGC